MIFDYVFLVFLNCFGALQIARVRSRSRRLLFFQNPYFSIIFGFGLGALGFVWFFRSGPLHVPDTAGGLAGFQQFALFSFGAVVALILNWLLTSFLYYRQRAISHGEFQHMDSVKFTGLFQKFLRKRRNY